MTPAGLGTNGLVNDIATHNRAIAVQSVDLVELAQIAETVANQGISSDRLGRAGGDLAAVVSVDKSAPTILLQRAGSARGLFAGVAVPACRR